MTGDEHAHLDAAYVLGALSPTERQDFERHLATCTECAKSVRELAGLPGLLARLDQDEVRALGHQPPVPATVLPGLLQGAAGQQRRRRALSAFGALSGAAAVAALTLALADRPADGDPQAAQTPSATGETTSMTQLGQTRLSADLWLQQVAWGTRMSVRCSYRGAPPRGVAVPAYALVVHTSSGRVEQVATWRAVPGRVTTVDAATAAPEGQISSVEVRTATGLPLLRLVR